MDAHKMYRYRYKVKILNATGCGPVHRDRVVSRHISLENARKAKGKILSAEQCGGITSPYYIWDELEQRIIEF